MATAPTPRNPDISFDTIVLGLPITIDGREYEIRHPLSLSIGSLKRINQLGVEIDALENKPDLTADEEKALSDKLTEVCDRIINAPVDVRARLFDMQRIAAIRRFTQLRLSTPAATNEAKNDRRRSGKKKSRA